MCSSTFSSEEDELTLIRTSRITFMWSKGAVTPTIYSTIANVWTNRWVIVYTVLNAVADLHSKILDARPPSRGPNSFNFMQFLGKFGKIVCWRPPGELAPPPRGNPGSATEMGTFSLAIGSSMQETVYATRKHCSRMYTDRAVIRSDQVANKDEQWPSIHEADCEQNHRRLWKHYLPLRSVIIPAIVIVE